MVSQFDKGYRYTNIYYKDIYFEVYKVSEINKDSIVLKAILRSSKTDEILHAQPGLLVRKENFRDWNYYGIC